MEIYPQEIYLGTGRKATGAMAQDGCAAQPSPSTATLPLHPHLSLRAGGQAPRRAVGRHDQQFRLLAPRDE